MVGGGDLSSEAYPLAAHRPRDLVVVQVPFELGRHVVVKLLLRLWLPLQAGRGRTCQGTASQHRPFTMYMTARTLQS